MAREVTTRDLEQLGDERFEQLVASLVFAEQPDAERPANPDGGADVLVPAGAGRRARVWQAKHHTTQISWTKCERSLDEAVASYDPEEVVFVFPRNLSKPQRETFAQRLVARPTNARVRHWGLHGLQERLARHTEIAMRYFGEDRADTLPGLIRAFGQGGKELENSRDVAERAFALDDFADTSDPSYEYRVSVGGADLPDHVLPNPPFLVLSETRDGRQLSTEAYLRPEADADAWCGFTDDDAGKRAREFVREAFAAGEPAELTEGVWLLVDNAPIVFREALSAAADEQWSHGHSTLSPGPPTDFSLHVGEGEDGSDRRFSARPLPPSQGWHLSYGSIENGLALFADFAASTFPKVSMNLRLSWRRCDDASVNAEAARFMLDFLAADRVVCTAEELLPAGGMVVARANKADLPELELAHLEFMAALYDAVAVIEAHFGALNVPESVARADFERAVAVASILRQGGGTLSFEELSIDLPLNEVDDFLRRADAGHPGRHPARFNVFGRELDLGLAEFNTPPIRLISTERSAVEGMARLRLRTDNASICFRLTRAAAETSSRQTSAKLWTPTQGDSGLVQLPGR